MSKQAADLWIQWEIDDGYGECHFYTTRFELSDFSDDMDTNAIRGVIEEKIQDDFERRVSPNYDTQHVDDLAMRVLVALVGEKKNHV